MTPDLRTTYLGLELHSPLVASASPLTGTIDSLRRLAEAGAGALVLPSLFEEQLAHESIAVDRLLSTGVDLTPEATGFFPELDDYNTGADRYLALVERARTAVPIPVIASLNGTSVGGWVRYARLLEFAGADALELNLYAVEADRSRTAADIEARDADVIAALRAAVRVPIAVKLSPYFTSLANVADAFVRAGADGLVLFNRFYQPDIDLDTLTVEPRLVLSSSDELRLPLRWTAILRGQLGSSVSLALTSGVHGSPDVLKALLAGADVAMMASALLRGGPGVMTRITDEVRAWMAEREYESVRQLRGSMSQASVPDPVAFERAQYLKTIATYPV